MNLYLSAFLGNCPLIALTCVPIYFSLKVTAMNEFADRLHGEGHFESGEIQRRKQAVLERRSRVKGAAVERRNKLEDCRKLMVFLQNVMEVSIWACKPAPTGFYTREGLL